MRRHTLPTQVLLAWQSTESLLSHTPPVADSVAQVPLMQEPRHWSLLVQAWPLLRRQVLPWQVLPAAQSVESLLSQNAPVADGVAQLLFTQVLAHWVFAVQVSPLLRRQVVPMHALPAA